MRTTRRSFVSALAGAAALSAAPAKKRILILGGTGFLGPATVEAARTRGHELTLFNRGRTRPGLFPDIETLLGDRDPDKDEGLKVLRGRQWDAVIDNSGNIPRHVAASAKLLAPAVQQYIHISSISAYADNSIEGQDETGAWPRPATPPSRPSPPRPSDRSRRSAKRPRRKPCPGAPPSSAPATSSAPTMPAAASPIGPCVSTAAAK
jgi:2'-hydroxyisoflavone reductase